MHYDLPGIYDVTLVTINVNGSDTIIKENLISVNESLTAAFAADRTSLYTGESVTFSDQSAGAPNNWNWIFEGGTPATSIEQNPTVHYDLPGIYDVTLVVNNVNGSDTIIKENLISVNESLTAAFAAGRTSLYTGESVTFSDQSAGAPDNWNWIFEGGTPASSSERNPIVQYDHPGIYGVTLVVINADGSDTIIKENLITVTENLIAAFLPDKTSLFAGESITFTDRSTGTPTAWDWVFEGGTPAASSQQNPVVQYSVPGVYKVSLTVSNANGSDTKTAESFITVSEQVPAYCQASGTTDQEWIAMVEAGNNRFSSGASVDGYEDFTNSGIISLEAGTVCNLRLTPGFLNRSQNEYWNIWIDFNNDTYFDDASELVFSGWGKKEVSGSFNVPVLPEGTTRMRIIMKRNSNASACETFAHGEAEDYTVQIIAPVPKAPVAEFAASNTVILVNESIQFTDLSQNSPAQWQWSFPGGMPESSSEQNPTVRYSAPGEYDVVLVVTKENFSPSRKEKLKYIIASEESVNDYCIPVSINSNPDYIQNVTIGNMFTYTSAGTGYTNDMNTYEGIAGVSYPVTLTPQDPNNRNYWKIWMDFNGDGDFNDSGETLLAAKNKRGSFIADIIIPAYANGTTRMRIAMQTGGDPSPCDDNYMGEVEDYSISFSGAAAAVNITGLEENILLSPGKIIVYPNPADNYLNFIPDEKTAAVYYSIFNTEGKNMLSGKIGQTPVSVEVSSFPAGMYYLMVTGNNRIFTEKFIKR